MDKQVDPTTSKVMRELSYRRKHKVGGFKDRELARQASMKGLATRIAKRNARMRNETADKRVGAEPEES